MYCEQIIDILLICIYSLQGGIKTFNASLNRHLLPFFNFISLRTLRSHDSSSKELADETEPISTALKFPSEKIVLVCPVYLSLADLLDRGILWRADWTFWVLVGFVETSLVE